MRRSISIIPSQAKGLRVITRPATPGAIQCKNDASAAGDCTARRQASARRWLRSSSSTYRIGFIAQCRSRSADRAAPIVFRSATARHADSCAAPHPCSTAPPTCPTPLPRTGIGPPRSYCLMLSLQLPSARPRPASGSLATPFGTGDCFHHLTNRGNAYAETLASGG